jgi:hypothetical protein
LKNKGVLLIGIGRGKEFFFLKELFLGWGWVVGGKGGYYFFSLFVISHNKMT